MADNRRDRGGHTWVTGAGFGVLTVNSALAIYQARDDAGAVAFVAGSYLTLLLLFGALREYERAAPGSPARARARRAVWPLTTLLTTMVASGVAPTIMPLAVGALVLLCLRDVDQVIRAGDGGGRVANMDAQYSALAKVGVAVLTCNAALDDDAYDARRDDPGAAALVLVSYAVLVILTGLFVRAVARAHAGNGEHGQG